MRRALIACASRNTAKRRAPWACVVTKVDGGFLAFESASDFFTWRNQR